LKAGSLSMPLPEALSRCLQELASHYEEIHSHNAELLQEIETMSTHLSAFASNTSKPGSFIPWQAAPSGTQEIPGIPDDCGFQQEIPGVPDTCARSEISEVPKLKVNWSLELEGGSGLADEGKDLVEPPLLHVDNSLCLLPIPMQFPVKNTGSYVQQPLSPQQTKDLFALYGADFDEPDTLTLGAARLGMITTLPALASASKNGFMETVWAFKNAHMQTAKSRPGMPMIQKIEASVSFQTLCTLAIVANTIYLGFITDIQLTSTARKVGGGSPGMSDSQSRAICILDILFVAWFTLELVVRVWAKKMEFFVGNGWKWNVFDALLVLSSLAEMSLPSMANISFLRIFRVFRLGCVIRVIRTVQALKSLRTMVFSMINSLTCLAWAFVMIFLIIFCFSIIFGNAVASYFESFDENDSDQLADAANLVIYFGSISEIFVSLFCAVSGGNDWMTYGSPMRALDPNHLYFGIFVFYVAFCYVGVLNVVTGIFVDTAVCTRTEDEVVEHFTEDQRRTGEEVRRIFKEADRDSSGSMTFDEFATHLDNPWVKAYLSGLDIDTSDARVIFTLMDVDGSEQIDIDEFVDGTMKIKGSAKSIDILSLMFDHARFSHKFGKFCSHMEDQLREIKDLIEPGAASRRPRLFRPTEMVLEEIRQNTHMRPLKLKTLEAMKSRTILEEKPKPKKAGGLLGRMSLFNPLHSSPVVPQSPSQS